MTAFLKRLFESWIKGDTAYTIVKSEHIPELDAPAFDIYLKNRRYIFQIVNKMTPIELCFDFFF